MIENYRRLLNIILMNNEEEDQEKQTYFLYYKRNQDTEKEDYFLIGASDKKNDLIDFLKNKSNGNEYTYLKKHNLKNSCFYIEKATDTNTGAY